MGGEFVDDPHDVAAMRSRIMRDVARVVEFAEILIQFIELIKERSCIACSKWFKCFDESRMRCTQLVNKRAQFFFGVASLLFIELPNCRQSISDISDVLVCRRFLRGSVIHGNDSTCLTLIESSLSIEHAL
ncbi:hypothetical protein CJO69_30650 [Burkholderia ubonensis]|nr:hypothetical protein CJO69_30650 [Burkholderia ubonensis]RQP76156.1 hypothetical protein DF013_12565 [Burkholderia ubonensis]